MRCWETNGGEDDDSVVLLAAALERLEDAAQVLVALRDQAVVRAPHLAQLLLPHLRADRRREVRVGRSLLGRGGLLATISLPS